MPKREKRHVVKNLKVSFFFNVQNLIAKYTTGFLLWKNFPHLEKFDFKIYEGGNLGETMVMRKFRKNKKESKSD